MTLAMWRLTYTRCAERAAAALVTAALALVPAIAAEQAPAPPAAAAPKDDGQWAMPAKNYAATRFSELDQINGGNVANLRVEFTFSTGVNRGQEAAPLVVDNTMYIVTPYPNILFALDLKKPGAPLKWEYQPHPAVASQGVACCDVVNRGATFWDGCLIDSPMSAEDDRAGGAIEEPGPYNVANTGLDGIIIIPLIAPKASLGQKFGKLNTTPARGGLEHSSASGTRGV